MLLQPVQLGLAKRVGIQPLVHIAIEGQHRLLGIAGVGLGTPGLVAADIQRRELVAQAHQRGNLLRRLLAQHGNQLGRLLGKQRRAMRGHHGRGIVIKGFGGRENKQHGRNNNGRQYAMPAIITKGERLLQARRALHPVAALLFGVAGRLDGAGKLAGKGHDAVGA